jgi:hypothetical protein
MLVDVPAGKDPISYVWGEMVPKIGPAAAKFSAAVYAHSSLGLREFEAARPAQPGVRARHRVRAAGGPRIEHVDPLKRRLARGGRVLS